MHAGAVVLQRAGEPVPAASWQSSPRQPPQSPARGVKIMDDILDAVRFWQCEGVWRCCWELAADYQRTRDLHDAEFRQVINENANTLHRAVTAETGRLVRIKN